MASINRRSALALLGAAPIAAMGARYGFAPSPGSLNVSQASTLATGEFGPTGAHWPSRTPRTTDRFDVTIDCGCTWAEISAAIQNASTQAPGGNVRVRVAPGTLPGNGAGSSKRPVLQNIGRAGRGRRVLVVPRDGSQSVQFSAGLRIDQVVGVAFAGFWIFPQGMVLTGVSDFAWAWSKGRAFNVSTDALAPINDLELVECVTPESQLTESDAWAARTAGSPISNFSVIGSYIASNFKPDGSQAHLDTFQLSGTHPLNGVTIRDSVIFASTNAAFIPTTLAAGVLFDHSLVVAGSRMLERYPLPAGARPFANNYPQAANGSGTNGVMSARNSTLVGSIPGIWGSVVASSTSAAKTSANSGQWTYDPSLATIDASWLEKTTPTPTDDRLRATWIL